MFGNRMTKSPAEFNPWSQKTDKNKEYSNVVCLALTIILFYMLQWETTINREKEGN
jgi:hypothetical protein